MKSTKLLTTIFVTSSILMGCQTITNQKEQLSVPATSTTQQVKSIHNVQWNKMGEAFTIPDNSKLTENQSRAVFLRLADQDVIETSVIIGIDNRFQTSLQPGQYSQTILCSGQHKLNAEITGSKTNNLAHNAKNQFFQPKQTHYFQVDVNNQTNQPTITAIDETKVSRLLNSATRQTHQISRVEANKCPTIKPIPTPIVPATPVATVEEMTSPPVQLNKPIRLDVLFDFDSTNIKPDYNQKLQQVAQFMQTNTNIHAVLEGYTDSKGSAAYNLRLSKARADSVKNVLVKKYGVDTTRIATTGYGETKPIDTNSTKAGRKNNRRVIATLTQH